MDEDRKIEIILYNDGEEKETIVLKNTAYRDNGYDTEWETDTYPFIKITCNDYDHFPKGRDIEVISGNFSDDELDVIALRFNHYIDTFLNRPVLVNLRIKREDDDVAFQHGLVTVQSYKYTEGDFVLCGSTQTLLNNYNGYVQISHLVDKDLDNRFLKISELEIMLRIPAYENRNDEIFNEEVEYLNSDGIVLANSDRDDCPYVDIKVAHIRQKLIDGLDLTGELFIGEILY